MAIDVRCEVESCEFYKTGNKCSANEIYVVNHHSQHASTSHETDCKTFKPRG